MTTTLWVIADDGAPGGNRGRWVAHPAELHEVLHGQPPVVIRIPNPALLLDDAVVSALVTLPARVRVLEVGRRRLDLDRPFEAAVWAAFVCSLRASGKDLQSGQVGRNDSRPATRPAAAARRTSTTNS